MSNLNTFPFRKESILKIKAMQHGHNWPVVYIIEDGREIYIGETVSAYARSNQHYKNPQRSRLDRIHIISDDEYNVSAVLDIESFLIQHIAADGQMIIQNENRGLSDHNYFDKQRYVAKFEIIWEKLKKLSLVHKDLVQIKNSDLFKYSPYKALTGNQLGIAEDIISEIKSGTKRPVIVEGQPGTGKTILATYLVKALKDHQETRDLEIALVVPMTSLRLTLKKVFKNIKGLKPSMVVGPSEVIKSKYDLLIVDEAHRLRRRQNITNYRTHDMVNALLGLDKNGTELDWVMKSSSHQIFFYDRNQHVRPSDVRPEDFEELNSIIYNLESQLRVSPGKDGDHYLKFVQDLFDMKKTSTSQFSEYDFAIYDDLSQMVEDIKARESEFSLSRMVSGYAWPWVSKRDPSKHDIEIGDTKLIWNSVNQNWVYSKNAINEVGCIHTVQGYDLNYAGVIIGPELSYDKSNHKFIIDPEKYLILTDEKALMILKS